MQIEEEAGRAVKYFQRQKRGGTACSTRHLGQCSLLMRATKTAGGGCARMGGTEGGAPTKLKRNVSVVEHGYEKGSQRTWSRSMLHGWSSERCGRWPLGGGSVTRLTFLVKEVI